MHAAALRDRLRRVRGLPTAVLILALLLVLLSGTIAVTGGDVWTIGAIRLSIRTPIRPLIVALLFGALAYWLSPERLTAGAIRLRRLSLSRVGLLAGLVALVIIFAGIRWGTHAASGADSYGYVSQSVLWLKGSLIQTPTRPPKWPFSDWTISPLGYRPGPHGHTIVPVYSPGLPLLMAAASALVGAYGPYLIVPLLGGLAVLLTFVLGRLLFNRTIGFMASLWLAASPAFLFQLMWPMSDVPTLAGWTLALVFAVLERPFAAGLAAGCALVIRPNLAPLALPIVLLASWPAHWDRHTAIVALRRAFLGCLGLLPAAIGVALFYQHLFGSPLRSGYGSATTIYHLRYLLPNLGRYPVWLFNTETPLIYLAVLPFFMARFRTGGAANARPVRALLLLFLAMGFGSYLFYEPFKEWWYLRFVLPFFPVLLIFASAAVWTGLGLLAPRWRRWSPALVGIIVMVLAMHEASTAVNLGVLTLQRGERRYITIGQELDATMPANAVFLAMQESGSLRFYAHRMTFRYDEIPRSRLPRAIHLLEAGGYHPYLLIEQWEEPKFERRFAKRSAFGRLEWLPLKTWNRPAVVKLYDLASDPTDPAVPAASRRPPVLPGALGSRLRPTAADPVRDR